MRTEPAPEAAVAINPRLTKYKQKEMILKAAREKDFSHRLAAKRQALLPKMMEARRAGKIAYISYDRLIIKDKLPR